jgi:hypothetical protein
VLWTLLSHAPFAPTPILCHAGGPNPSDALTPSAALVKAVLLGGAQGMGGFDDYSGMPLTPPPSFGQGYGRVHLGGWAVGG